MREWEIGAVENIHGALPYIRFAPILALVGVGVNRIGKLWTKIEDRRTQIYLPLYWWGEKDLRSLVEELRGEGEHHFLVVRDNDLIRHEVFSVTSNANVRSAPSTSGAKMRTLPKGTEVQVVWAVPNGTWRLIALNGEILGFVHSDLLASVAP